eukprot:9505498-Prorocentrum_lima.AAC.1
MVQRMVLQRPPTYADVLCDADHAGYLRTRKSTGCFIMMHGHHIIEIISAAQDPLGLSIAES